MDTGLFSYKSFMPAAILTALLATSCSNDIDVVGDFNEPDEQTLVFSMRTPSGEKVSYSRADGTALHDEPEYVVKSLQLYEYEVTETDGEKTTSLSRILSYPTGTGKNVIDLKDGGDGSYSFSIVIPADYKNRTFTYRVVANNATTSVKTGDSVEKFRDNWFSAVILKNTTVQPETSYGEDGDETATPAEPITVSPKGDALADSKKGIAMTGSAKAKTSGSDEITIGQTTQCEVELTRIVSRIDLRYATPNLKLTKVELRRAPVKTYLWPRFSEDGTTPLYAEVDTLKIDLNSMLTLPDYYLNDEGHEAEKAAGIDLKKAFYMYERANTEENSAYVHLEYMVNANSTEYKGVLDVPFRRTSGDKAYIDTKRNHLYTIVLGNNDDPVSGKVSATLIVDDWNLVEIDEPITD